MGTQSHTCVAFDQARDCDHQGKASRGIEASEPNDVYDQAGIEAEPPFWIAGSGGFSPKRTPTDVGHSFASAWQGALDVVRTHNGVKLPIDISVAAVASPSLAATQ